MNPHLENKAETLATYYRTRNSFIAEAKSIPRQDPRKKPLTSLINEIDDQIQHVLATHEHGLNNHAD